MVKIFDRAKIDFIVKEDEGIVIAKFSDPGGITNDYLNYIDKYVFVDVELYEKIYNRVSTVRGIAKCAPEDKFDIKIGKRIALNHLKNKIAKSFTRYIVKLANETRDDYNKLVDLSVAGGLYMVDLEQRLRKIYATVESNN